MDYSQLESFLATSVPTPEFNKPPFKLEVSQTESGAYIISLLNSERELGMQVTNESPEGYVHAVTIFTALEARWNALAVLAKADLSGAANSSLVTYALNEFEAVGYAPLHAMVDGPDKHMLTSLVQMLRLLGEQNHDGQAIPFLISAFEKLARFEPLGPLTGEDQEWDEIEPGLFQNKRCAHVFMDATTGQSYDNEGKIFRSPDGNKYQSLASRVYITFPYTPVTEIVDTLEYEGAAE